MAKYSFEIKKKGCIIFSVGRVFSLTNAKYYTTFLVFLLGVQVQILDHFFIGYLVAIFFILVYYCLPKVF